MLINVKMPIKTVGILTFMSMIMPAIVGILIMNVHDKPFHAEYSWA